MKRIGLFLSVMALFLAGAFMLLSRTDSRRERRIHDDFLPAADKSVKYDAIFADLNKMRAPWQGRAGFCVNAAFREDCANVIIVDRATAGRVLDRRERELLLSLDHNAIAVPPSLILIDKQLVSRLTFETQSLLTAASQAIIERDASPLALSTEFALASARDDYVIEMTSGLAKNSGNQSALNAYTARLLNEVANAAASRKTPEHDIQKNMFEISFGLLLEHEAAHLNAKGRSFGIDRMLGGAFLGDNRLTLAEEDRADAVAISSIDKYVTSLRRSATPETSRVYSNPVFLAVPFLVQAEYYRDSALQAGLSGFRGFRTDDLALEFWHKPCDPSRPRRANYFDPSDILFARRKPLPILTNSEWKRQRIAFARVDLPQTHSHEILRAEKIYSHLKESSGDWLRPLMLENDVNFIQALLNNNPRAAFPTALGFMEIENTSIDRLIERTRGYVDFEPAVTCPMERCYVGRIENDDGYIEVIGGHNKIAELRVVMNLGVPNLRLGDAGLENYVKDASEYLAVMAAASPDKDFDELAIAGALRYGLFRCGVSSTLITSDKKTVAYHSTVLQRPGFIQIRMFNAALLS